jgi:hypothetical protein
MYSPGQHSSVLRIVSMRGVNAVSSKCLDAGLLALPGAFLLLGAIPTAAAFSLMAALVYFSADCLILASRVTGKASYCDVVAHELGSRAGRLFSLCVALFCFGASVLAGLADLWTDGCRAS